MSQLLGIEVRFNKTTWATGSPTGKPSASAAAAVSPSPIGSPMAMTLEGHFSRRASRPMRASSERGRPSPGPGGRPALSCSTAAAASQCQRVATEQDEQTIWPVCNNGQRDEGQRVRRER